MRSIWSTHKVMHILANLRDNLFIETRQAKKLCNPVIMFSYTFFLQNMDKLFDENYEICIIIIYIPV